MINGQSGKPKFRAGSNSMVIRGAIGLLLLASCCAAPAGRPGEPSPLFDIPRLDKIGIDGDSADWGAEGYYVDDIRRYGAPAASTAISARLGWNRRGIVCLVQVTDGSGSGAFAVEVSISARRGDPNILQWQMRPNTNSPSGLTPIFRDLRRAPELKRLPAEIECAGQKGKPGEKGATTFTYEALIPWAGLGIIPAVNRETALQLTVLDGNGGLRNVWYQGKDLHPWPDHIQRIRLRDTPGIREVFHVTKFIPNPSAGTIGLGIVKRGNYDCGRKLRLLHDDKVVAEAEFGGGRLDVQFPMPPLGDPYTNLVIDIGGEKLGRFELNTDDLYFEGLDKRRLGFRQHIFSGDTFPGCDFTDANAARQILPDYEINTRYYDADCNEVAKPGKPGRYGAIVSYGNKTVARKRYVTLYKLAGAYDGNQDPERLSQLTGITPDLARTFNGGIVEALQRKNSAGAIVLALLRDRSTGACASAFVSKPDAREKQWWTQLRSRLGEDATGFSPHPFAVMTPAGYKDQPEKKWGMILYCPGRENDLDGTWASLARSPGALLTWKAEGCPFIVCIPQSYWSYSPEELAGIIDIMAVQYRVDQHKIFAVGNDSDADAVRLLATRYPGRLAAAILMQSNKVVKAADLSGTAGDKPEYSKRGRNAYLAEPPNPFSKEGYEWLAGLHKSMPGEAIKPDPMPAAVKAMPPEPALQPEKPARFIQALKAGKKQTIVCLGTSLTSGGAWVTQFQAELDKRYPGLARVLNYGASGQNGGHGLGAAPGAVKAGADAIFIEYSINEAKDAQMHVETSRDTFLGTVKRIREGNPDCEIFPMTMNCCEGGAAARRPTLHEFYQAYRDAARELGLPCIDHNRNWVRIWEEDPDLFMSYIPDGCHPGGSGCAAVIVPELLRAVGLE